MKKCLENTLVGHHQNLTRYSIAALALDQLYKKTVYLLVISCL